MKKRDRFVAGLLTLALLGSALAYAQPWRGGLRGAPGVLPGMTAMMVTDEFSFLAGMIPHHQEAIDSAKTLRAGSERAEFRALAEEIIRTQTAEIEVLRELLAANYPGRAAEVEAAARAYQPMMRDLTGLTGDALGQAFLQDMIHHHMMAVMMSRHVLAAPSAPETRELALSIIGQQTREMVQMRIWLREWYALGVGPRGGPAGGVMIGARGWRAAPAAPGDPQPAPWTGPPGRGATLRGCW